MSWTSEHEPSAPTHPGAAASVPAEPPGSGGVDDATHDAADGSDHDDWPGDDEIDPLSDDGPLDPSVFDGLFDDLVPTAADAVADNPLDEFLRAPLAETSDDPADADGDELDPIDLDELLLDTPPDDPDVGGGVVATDGFGDDVELAADGFALDDLFPERDGAGAAVAASAGHDTGDGAAGDGAEPLDVDPDPVAVDQIESAADVPQPLILDPIGGRPEPGLDQRNPPPDALDVEPTGDEPIVVDRPMPGDGAGGFVGERADETAADDERRWSDGSFATGGADVDPDAPVDLPVDAPPSEVDRPMFRSALDVTPPPPLGPPPSDADQLDPAGAPPAAPSPWEASAAAQDLMVPAPPDAGDARGGRRPERRSDAPDDWYNDQPSERDDRRLVDWDRRAADPAAPARFAPAGEPGTATPADGPFRASPPIQHDPEPELPLAAPVEPAPVDEPALVGRRRRPGRVAVLILALLIGSLAGVGGAIVLATLTGGDDEQLAAPVETASELTEGSEAAAPAAPLASGATVPDPAAIEATTLTSLRFAGDGTSLAPSPTLDLLAELIATRPDQPIAATIRTYTETTAASDLTRSADQAAALAASLVELGADPTQVSVLGLGRSLLNPSQPVPNFVVPSAGLATSPLSLVADEVGPFAIGLDRATGELRPESFAALDRLAQTMATDTGGPHLTLAAYSFDLPDPEANETQATAAAGAARDHLAAAGVDPARVRVVIAGDDSFAVPDRVANHIDLRWGAAADAELTLQSIDIEGIDFASGSAELDAATTDIVDELAAVIVSSGAEAVIDVQSFDGLDSATEVDLSVRRAQAVGQRLLVAGVAAERLRLHGGATPQFRAEEGNCRLVVTLIQPPTRS